MKEFQKFPYIYENKSNNKDKLKKEDYFMQI